MTPSVIPLFVSLYFLFVLPLVLPLMLPLRWFFISLGLKYTAWVILSQFFQFLASSNFNKAHLSLQFTFTMNSNIFRELIVSFRCLNALLWIFATQYYLWLKQSSA